MKTAPFSCHPALGTFYTTIHLFHAGFLPKRSKHRKGFLHIGRIKNITKMGWHNSAPASCSKTVVLLQGTTQTRGIICCLKQLLLIWKTTCICSTHIIKVNKPYLCCCMWLVGGDKKLQQALQITKLIQTNKHIKYFATGYREGFVVHAAFANVFLPDRLTTRSKTLWWGFKCRQTENNTMEWKQTVTVSSQANTDCLLMANTNTIQQTFLCENRQLAREWPCKGHVFMHIKL